MSGKAQEVVAALPLEDSLNYDMVKTAVLQAYELVPEAYRQRFRQQRKSPTQTHVEFSREKSILFDKWCAAYKVDDLSSLRELILLEEFKRSLPERLVVYLNEQKVNTVTSAAVLADEYTLTHKTSFPVPNDHLRVAALPQPTHHKSNISRETRECFYCQKPGHVIANCNLLKSQPEPAQQSPSSPKGIGVILRTGKGKKPDPCFKPFIFQGLVSLSGKRADERSVRILRDTGGAQTVILANSLKFSEHSSSGYSTVLRGIGVENTSLPVHRVHLRSDLVSGVFPMAVCPGLPVKGVAVLLGNDVAGGKVPHPGVLPKPTLEQRKRNNQLCTSRRKLYPACAFTHAQTLNYAHVNLTDGTDFCSNSRTELDGSSPSQVKMVKDHKFFLERPGPSALSGRAQLRAAQRRNPSLRTRLSGGFAACGSAQESLEISPADPLRALEERFPTPPENRRKRTRVFFRQNCKCLCCANALSKKSVASSQGEEHVRDMFAGRKSEFQRRYRSPRQKAVSSVGTGEPVR
uniref:SCAN box domain-containing protein n=1 Tax=Oryzias melastigma TaxID=30732 RepID=A0A3B3CNQ8_ORYME